MAFSKKLFHLGNQVVSIGKSIDKHFPSTVNDPFNERNHLKHTLVELLDLINNIRLAIQDDEPKEWWNLKVRCNSQELLALKEQAEVLELQYELSKSESKQ